MNFRNLVLFSLMAISSITACNSESNYDRNGRNRAMNKVFRQAREHFCSEYNLDLIGPLTSSSKGPIERITLVLEQDSDPSIDEAKSILVGVTSYFYDLARSNEELFQYLANPPFQLRDLDVLIVFEHYNLSEYSSPFVASISLDEEKVKIDLHENYQDLRPSEEIYFTYAELKREFGKSCDS